MRTNKLFFNLPMMVALMFGSVGCSSSDDGISNRQPADKLDVTSNIEGNIVFNLCDITMKPKMTFIEGENIVFDMAIENTSDKDFCLRRGFEGGDLILDDRFFCVYNEKGEPVGTPWTGVFCEDINIDVWYYPAHTTRHIICNWNYEMIGSSHPFCDGYDNDNRRETLSAGNYYVMFNVKYNTNIGKTPQNYSEQKFIKHFTVTPAR